MEDALELARRIREEGAESGKKAHELLVSIFGEDAVGENGLDLDKMHKLYQFHVTLKKKEDEKIVEKFESVPNKTDYIRQLVLADIEKNKQN